MYRCTACHTEFEECPAFCDCGNDEFIEIADSYEEEPVMPSYAKNKKLTKQEIEELENEAREKLKTKIAAGVILILCIVVFFLPPHKKNKMSQVKQKVSAQQVKLPSVDSYWDNSLPSTFRAKDPSSNLPLLNERFSSISPILREYLVEVGNQFNRKWDTSIVKNSGECKVEFTINKEGNLNTKKIVASSHNESLDDSVLLLFSTINSFDVPPDDYKGERIYITFKVDQNGDSHVKYPMK